VDDIFAWASADELDELSDSPSKSKLTPCDPRVEEQESIQLELCDQTAIFFNYAD
jgi:hypothetical protein